MEEDLALTQEATKDSTEETDAVVSVVEDEEADSVAMTEVEDAIDHSPEMRAGQITAENAVEIHPVPQCA